MTRASDGSRSKTRTIRRKRGGATCSTGHGSGPRVRQASGRDQTLDTVSERRLSDLQRPIVPTESNAGSCPPKPTPTIILTNDEVGCMRFVPVKTEEQQANGIVFRARDLLVRQRTQCVNALRGHLMEYGYVFP